MSDKITGIHVKRVNKKFNEVSITSKTFKEMSNNKDENDIPLFIQELLSNIIKDEGFINHVIEYNLQSHHLTTLYNVQVRGKKTVTDVTDHELNLICKISPSIEQKRKQFTDMQLLEQEVKIYTTVLPAFTNFQKQKNIDKSNGFYEYPKCYYAQLDRKSLETIIIMEDLFAQGYRNFTKTTTVDYMHSRKIMIELGRFHAISFALKEQQPEKFEELRTFENTCTEERVAVIGKVLELALNRVLNVIPETDKVKIEKLLKIKETVVEDLQKCLNGEDSEPYSVITHGDCITNNFMFRYKNGIPEDIMLLDWQIIRYTTPVLDIINFLFVCTNEKFRHEHYDNMIQVYYKSFREHLERLDGKPGEQFPYTALIRQLKFYGKYGLIISALMIPILWSEGNSIVPDTDNSGINEITFEGESSMSSMKYKVNYKDQMVGVLSDLIRLGYL